MTRPLLVIYAAATLAAAYAVARIRALGFDVDPAAVPVWAWAFLAGFAIRLRGAVRFGQWKQAALHMVLAVGKGHAHIIRGIK